MTFAVNVKGGSGAGRKRPLREKPQTWECRCVYEADEGTCSYQLRPGYLTRCADCGAERP